MIKDNNIFIQKKNTILEALKQMDRIEKRLLIVLDGDLFFSLISIGDIQRAILSNIDLKKELVYALRSKVKVAYEDDDISKIKMDMKVKRNEFMPIVSKENKVIDVVFFEDLYDKVKHRKKINLNIPVIIMAGGEGSRLKPITNILPKALIPIGEKTILEEIMNKFLDAGCDFFMLSVNYKADMIKHYFKTLDNESYKIDYFEEKKPLGTAGSMYLMKDKISTTFFVSNCDIIIGQDLEDIYNYHMSNKNMVTIVSVLKHNKIPYGTIETGNQGAFKSLSEKPDITYQINSGMYILEPEALDYIPDNTFFHITELIEKVRQAGKRVGVFPVNEGSWKDIGEWDKYLKMINNE